MSHWKTAFISGGGSGIGRRIAEVLLREGTSVAIFDRDDKPEVAVELDAIAAKTPGVSCTFYRADVTDSKGLVEAAKRAATEVGQPNFAAAILPLMGKGGQLALIASLAGLVPSYSYAAYNASKHGVVGLAGALRLEYIEKGIEVSVICPPEIDTPMVVGERKSM